MEKKILFILLIGVVGIMSIGASKEKENAKNQKIYEVKSLFYYSDDAGKTYGDSRKEFKVGETVYMRLDIEITDKKEKNILFFLGGGAVAGLGIGVLAGASAGATIIPGVGNVIGAIGGGLLGGVIGGVSGIGSYFLTKPNLDFVECKLIIPNITSVDAKYYYGTEITPLKDEVSGITTYPIKIGISKENKDAKNRELFFVFSFIPNAESEVAVKLIFDDNIAEQYDRMSTIKFVK